MSIWVIRDLESHQTARHFLGESPAEREHFESAINNLKVRLLWRITSGKENPEAFSPRHTLTHALFIFPTIHHFHSFNSLHPHPFFYHPSSPHQSLVKISETPVASGHTSAFLVKIGRGCAQDGDLYLVAIMVLCTEEVTAGISVKV